MTPRNVFSQGYPIVIEGDFFGGDSRQLRVQIGDSFICSSVELLHFQTSIQCIASGSGNNLPLIVTVGNKSSASPHPLISFKGL